MGSGRLKRKWMAAGVIGIGLGEIPAGAEPRPCPEKMTTPPIHRRKPSAPRRAAHSREPMRWRSASRPVQSYLCDMRLIDFVQNVHGCVLLREFDLRAGSCLNWLSID